MGQPASDVRRENAPAANIKIFGGHVRRIFGRIVSQPEKRLTTGFGGSFPKRAVPRIKPRQTLHPIVSRSIERQHIEPLLNMSVNETLSRTIVTSLSLILTLTILLVLGPDVSFGFTAAMLLGIVIGTFSSIYVSAPILIWLKVGPNSFVPAAVAGVNERNVKPEGFIK